MTRTSPALGRGKWNSSMVRGLLGSQNTAPRMNPPELTWYAADENDWLGRLLIFSSVQLPFSRWCGYVDAREQNMEELCFLEEKNFLQKARLRIKLGNAISQLWFCSQLYLVSASSFFFFVFLVRKSAERENKKQKNREGKCELIADEANEYNIITTSHVSSSSSNSCLIQTAQNSAFWISHAGLNNDNNNIM